MCSEQDILHVQVPLYAVLAGGGARQDCLSARLLAVVTVGTADTSRTAFAVILHSNVRQLCVVGCPGLYGVPLWHYTAVRTSHLWHPACHWMMVGGAVEHAMRWQGRVSVWSVIMFAALLMRRYDSSDHCSAALLGHN
jgi:hypothetical protein